MKITSTNDSQIKLTAKTKLELIQQIKPLYLNKELIEFISSKIHGSTSEKLACLFYFKKIVQQIHRKPDEEHIKAFEELYEAEKVATSEEQSFYEPVKWLNAEIEYLQNVSSKLELEQRERMAILETAQGVAKKDWLTRQEVMLMFKISKSTLNRRISEGMPCHKKGKAIYFYLDEISNYLKGDAA